MKKTILIAALFAVGGIASAQNTAPATAASAPAVKPAVTTAAAKPVETSAKSEGAKKAHVKTHAKHAAKKDGQAKAGGAETVAKADTPTAQKAASAPAK